MKKITIIVSFILFSAISAMAGTKEYFKGDNIVGLICDGTVNIQLSEDPYKTGVFIDYPEGSEPDVTITKTAEEYVSIKFGNDFNKAFKSKLTIKVAVSALKYMKLSGATAVIAKGKFTRSNKVEIVMEGSSASADFLDIAAKEVKMDLAGLTSVDELTLNVDSFTLISGGTGPKFNATAGKVSKANIDISGASKIVMVNLPVGVLDAKVVGTASVKANIESKGYVKVSFPASFRYMGGGVVEGEGSFKPL